MSKRSAQKLAIDDAHGGDLADLVHLRVEARGLRVEDDEGQVLQRAAARSSGMSAFSRSKS
jgi:hypothetical protein